MRLKFSGGGGTMTPVQHVKAVKSANRKAIEAVKIAKARVISYRVNM